MNAIIPLIHASLPLYPWKTRFPTFLLQLGRVVLRRNLTMVLDDIVFNGNSNAGPLAGRVAGV